MKKSLLAVTIFGLILTVKAQENKIESTGNVGIGRTNPTANLEVYKWDDLAHTRIFTNQHAGMAKLEIAGGVAGFGAGYSGWNIYHSNNQTGKDLYFRHGQTGDPNIVFTDNGNLGIGTKNPNANLEVYRFDGLSHARIFTNQHAGMAKLEIAGGVAGFGAGYSGWSIYHSYGQTNKDLYFRHGQSGNPNVVFTDNGNVGIGTINPDMKMTVKGNIHAEEVKIDLNVPAPDYVFKENYNLMSIEEVEKFIKENNHLPEIPSAQEFKQNGVMLAEMDMNLLKKIEELTLYTIQQEKKISEQSHEIEELKSLNKKLFELQSRLEKLESEK
ncbi:tail fiber protein [Aquimarina aggregata]|uniref:tail fiber protein n=1 Tax=Aquimarina aggregata TaxID=1642818 RepID=UPI002490A340|nr:tail fiber protein [Aquimarina aggregata]